MKYKPFDIRIESARKKFRLRCESTKGRNKAKFDIKAARKIAADWNNGASLEEVGTRLFRLLFPRPILRLFDQMRGDFLKDQGLRIRIRILIDVAGRHRQALQELPWEVLYCPDTRGFLARMREYSIVRFLEIPQEAPPLLVEPPLTALLLVGDGTGLDLHREAEALQTGFGPNASLRFESLDGSLSLDSLGKRVIESRCHVLHYLGHAGTDLHGEGVLYIPGVDKAVTGSDLAERLRGGPKLVVLNACETGMAARGKTDPFLGVAHSLVAALSIAVVAMRAAIPDPVARAFAIKFYEHLFRSGSVDEAMVEGRLAIHQKDLSWALPALFLQAPEGCLFDSGTDEDSQIEDIREGGTTWSRPFTSAWSGLAANSSFHQMLRVVYLTLRIDQYTYRLGPSDPYRQDAYLWGWSICDPRRKKKVAKPQTLEPRAASIVVTSFVLAGLFDDVPRFGLRAADVFDDLVRSLQRRYRNRIFGTLQSTIANYEGRIRRVVVPNCRHIAAAVSILLRLLAMQSRTATILGLPRQELRQKANAALTYLCGLSREALFSEEPDEETPSPDVGTCAKVLELLEQLGHTESLLRDDPSLPDDRQDLHAWRERSIRDGIEFLSQHRERVASGLRLWHYPPSKKWTDIDGEPRRMASAAPLYHTARILYLTRNLLAEPRYNERLIESAEDLAIYAQRGLLPAQAADAGAFRPHITNTAFFLNALLPHEGGPPSEALRNALATGLEALPDAFFDATRAGTFELLDLRADGLGMIMRLARKLVTHKARERLADELRPLDQVAAKIQRAIQDERLDDITTTLQEADLTAATPLVMDRVVEARRLWQRFIAGEPLQ